MSYESMQTALRTVLTGIPGYTVINVSLADYRVLQKGYTKSMVMRPGPFERERLDFAGGHQTTWDIILELFVKYQDDTQVQNSIRDERQSIIDQVDTYPFLNGASGCFHAMITRGLEPAPVFGEDGSGPHFFLQEMTCKVVEQVTVSEAE